MSILLDAGPVLNFLAVGQQNILIKVAESHDLRIEAPERVDHEVLGMTNDPRFMRTAAKGTWGWATGGLLRNARKCPPRLPKTVLPYLWHMKQC